VHHEECSAVGDRRQQRTLGFPAFGFQQRWIAGDDEVEAAGIGFHVLESALDPLDVDSGFTSPNRGAVQRHM
jgi:hypothetical protein